MLAGLFNSREILALTPPSGHPSPNSRRGENKHKFRWAFLPSLRLAGEGPGVRGKAPRV
jgi:hypothetical protein